MNRTRALSVGRDLLRTIQTKQVSFLSASIAYYMFVSLLLVLLVGTFVGGQTVAAQVVDAVGSALVPILVVASFPIYYLDSARESRR